ncbi:hypothetical protein R6Q57_018399 [Mikania cordata]
MEEEKVQEKHSNSHPEANPGDQNSHDTFVTPGSSSRCKMVDFSLNVDRNGSSKQLEKYDLKAGYIDTVAVTPLESAKETVFKVGSIADWKAHRIQTNERSKLIQQELDKAQEEILLFKLKFELAEQAKEQALIDLDSTKRRIQELKLNLELAQTEEHQAKQDSELAQLQLQEAEQGITDESSVAAKTQLEVAKARHQEVASKLITAQNELKETRKDYAILTSEQDSAVEKAQEAVSAAIEVEQEIENLTIQLITTKESIEYIHASHLEAEEQRIQEANELDQEMISLDHELKQTEEELEKVRQQIVLADELKLKLETASGLLQNLKDKLAVYLQGKMREEDDDEKLTREDIQSGIAIAKKNLDDINRIIERTTKEITRLKTTAKSVTAVLEGEKQVLMNFRKQNGSEMVSNLESELKQTRLELDDSRRREKEACEKLVELPNRLQKASEETENAKLFAEGASLVLKKAKEAADQAKNSLRSLTSQLTMTEKETEDAWAQEKLALGAISALHESESARCMKTVDPKNGITITLVEYYELSKRAHEAEEAASKRVAEATAEIDEAKQSLDKLKQVNSEIAARNEALKEEDVKEENGETKKDLKVDDGKSGISKKKKTSFMPMLSFMFMGKKKTDV